MAEEATKIGGGGGGGGGEICKYATRTYFYGEKYNPME